MSNAIEGIEGKIVVITGASSGLGEATARHLSLRGATVVLGARRLDRIDVMRLTERRGCGDVPCPCRGAQQQGPSTTSGVELHDAPDILRRRKRVVERTERAV